MADLGFDEWVSGGDSPMSESLYAVRAWRLIQRKPVSITIKRGKTTVLAAQTVRVEFSNFERTAEGASGAVSIKRDIIVFGVKGHPNEAIPDTNIKKSDLFEYEDESGAIQSMKVLDVVKVKGGIQAHCEAYS
jgi:hypothetical protein